jgi:hypothetical protein
LARDIISAIAYLVLQRASEIKAVAATCQFMIGSAFRSIGLPAWWRNDIGEVSAPQLHMIS